MNENYCGICMNSGKYAEHGSGKSIYCSCLNGAKRASIDKSDATVERIAAALERIADALEAQQKPNRTSSA